MQTVKLRPGARLKHWHVTKKFLWSLRENCILHITAVYREIVSGETISARPVMQQLLLSEVEKHMEWVLVVEVERLLPR